MTRAGQSAPAATGAATQASVPAPAVQTETPNAVSPAVPAKAASPAAQAAGVSSTAIKATAVQSQSSSSAAAAATAAASPAGSGTPESTDGRGLTTASGTPLIVPLSTPLSRIYDGPAAYNPYYWNGNTPYCAGNVTGYDNWFQCIKIGTFDPNSSNGYVMNPMLSANQEGGEEALRLVQQFVPDATLVTYKMPMQSADQPPSYGVQLPDGTLLSGGLVLSYYYNDGWGVTQGSDTLLKIGCGLLSPYTN